jgi:RNA polymerase sigma factor (sigma-70 family)
MSLDIEALYVAEYDRLCGYFRKRLSEYDTIEAADLAAAVFLRAWEKRHLYRPMPGVAPTSWLYRIATNLLTDHYRHRGKIAFCHLAETKSFDLRVGTDDFTDRLDAQIDVSRALGTYRTGNPAHAPDKQIAAVRAYYFERDTDLKIGARLGMSKASVTKLRMRALANLRKRLEAA